MVSRLAVLWTLVGTLSLGGCGILWGTKPGISATMLHDDGRKTSCMSGSYSVNPVFSGEREIVKKMKGCIAACQRYGFRLTQWSQEFDKYDDPVSLLDVGWDLMDYCRPKT